MEQIGRSFLCQSLPQQLGPGLLGRKSREWAVISVLCCDNKLVPVVPPIPLQPRVFTGSVLDEQELPSSSLPSLLLPLGEMWAGNFRAGSVCDTNSPVWSCVLGWPREAQREPTVPGHSWHSPKPAMAEISESLCLCPPLLGFTARPREEFL